nr:Chain B, Heat shock 70 kDa protein 1B [Homo sapiens]
SGPTIEEVD